MATDSEKKNKEAAAALEYSRRIREAVNQAWKTALERRIPQKKDDEKAKKDPKADAMWNAVMKGCHNALDREAKALATASDQQKRERLASQKYCDGCCKDAPLVMECTGGCRDMICQACVDAGTFNRNNCCHICYDSD